MPLILYPAITLAISYGMVHKGYTLGRDSIISLLQGGRIKELIYGANVLGLIMMGALSASFVKITSPLKISALKGSEVVVQQILDSIAPGLLPLAAVFAIYFYLVKKGPRYTTILLSIVALSVVCSPVPRSMRSTETNSATIFTSATFLKKAMLSRTAVPAVTTSSTMAMRSPSLGL